MADSKPRTIETPASERLTDAEAAAWCGIARKDWADMVRFAIIPEGAKRSRESQWWRWDVVMGVNALLEHLMPKLVRFRRKEQREVERAKREAARARRAAQGTKPTDKNSK